MNSPPIILNPSGVKSTPKAVMTGLLNTALLFPSQHQMVDGLLLNTSRGAEKASQDPIRARGSAVGAPTIPRGQNVPAFNPKTKTTPGVLYPVKNN